MAVAPRGTASNYLQRAPSPSGLADVIDLILDKGLVIDAYIRVAVIGIELVTIDARIVIASVDTYLRFAESVNRLALELATTDPRIVSASVDTSLRFPGSVNRLALTQTELAGLPELQEKGAEK